MRRCESRLVLFETLQSGENLFAVAGGIDLGPYLDDFSAGIDEEGIAVGDFEAGIVAERAVRGDDLLVLIAEQGKAKAVLGAELLVAIDGIDADTEDDGIL